ncbi:MAG: hypothetical protein GWP05_10890 [Anaerolineaceae bacterium]|nr:hypothetical protein [Anaerolineaceae bacterium]
MSIKPWQKLALTTLCLLLPQCSRSVRLVAHPPVPPFGACGQPGTRPTGSGRGRATRQVAGGGPPTWTPKVTERKWRYIVVHHSATSSGDAATFDRAHKKKGWDELGYHFVIGNGTLSGDGQVEIGPRWTKQKHGAHCKIRHHPEYNRIGVGICLVGNFDRSKPTEAQMKSLAKLIRWLMHRYRIPKSRVLGHGMLKATDCPGKRFDFNDLYRRL